jgi:hypothetical protein
MSSYAAKMIARFRESEPTSRGDRAAAKEAGTIKEMWWVDENEAPPRRAPRGNTPTLKSELSSTLGTTDSHHLARSMDMDSTMDKSVDQFIAAEIAELEKEVSKDRAFAKNTGAFNSTAGSFDMRRSGDGMSMNRTDKLESQGGATSYRYAGGGGGTRDPLADLRSSGDFFRSSMETLGSTGIKGLLMPELRLDGDAEGDREDEEDEFGLGGDCSGGDDGRVQYRGPIDRSRDPKSKLEDILKELEDAKLTRTETQGDHNGPGCTPSDIGMIASHLETAMHGLLAPLKERENALAEEEEERKRRDDVMKEEGRKSEYEKLILDSDRGEMDYATNTLLPAFMARSQAGARGEPERATAVDGASVGTGAGVAQTGVPVDVTNLAAQLAASAQETAILSTSGYPPGRTAARMADDPALFMQRVADQEVSMADSMHSQMRALQNDLAQRTRALNVVYASVMEGQQPPQRSLDILNAMNKNRQPGSNSGGGGVQVSQRGFAGDVDAPTPAPRFNPHPELVHKNILGTAASIGSMLDVAMNTLKLRLPVGGGGAPIVSPRPAVPKMDFTVLQGRDSVNVSSELDGPKTASPRPGIASKRAITASKGADTAVDTAALVATTASAVVDAATGAAVTTAVTTASTASAVVAGATGAAVENISGSPVRAKPVPAASMASAALPATTKFQDMMALAEIDRVLGSAPAPAGLDRFVPSPARAAAAPAPVPPKVAELQSRSATPANTVGSAHARPGTYRYGPLVVHDFTPFSVPSSTPVAQSSSYARHAAAPSAPPQIAFPYVEFSPCTTPTLPAYKPVCRPQPASAYDSSANRPPPTRPTEGMATFGLRDARINAAVADGSSAHDYGQYDYKYRGSGGASAPAPAAVPSANGLGEYKSAYTRVPVPVPVPVFSGEASAPINERRNYLDTMQAMRANLMAC